MHSIFIRILRNICSIKNIVFSIYTEIWYYNYKEHCVKCVRIRSFSGPHFPAFWLDTERYSVSFRIQSTCGKIRTIKTPNTDTFHAVEIIESVRNFQRRIQKPVKHVRWSVFRFSHIVRYLQGILGLQKKVFLHSKTFHYYLYYSWLFSLAFQVKLTMLIDLLYFTLASAVFF